jgi:hypothetical protein
LRPKTGSRGSRTPRLSPLPVRRSALNPFGSKEIAHSPLEIPCQPQRDEPDQFRRGEGRRLSDVCIDRGVVTRSLDRSRDGREIRAERPVLAAPYAVAKDSAPSDTRSNKAASGGEALEVPEGSTSPLVSRGRSFGRSFRGGQRGEHVPPLQCKPEQLNVLLLSSTFLLCSSHQSR